MMAPTVRARWRCIFRSSAGEERNSNDKIPGMSDITGVDFIALQTRDHATAAKFYGETLGLPFLKAWGKMPASEYQAGNLTLAVMQSDAFGFEFSRGSAM